MTPTHSPIAWILALSACVILHPAPATARPPEPNTGKTQPADPDAPELDDLSKRLIKGDDPGATDAGMAAVIADMEQAHARLTNDFDPGQETQQLQQRILDQLDVVIASAIRRGRPRGDSTGASDSQGDRRTRRPPTSDPRDQDPLAGGGADPTQGSTTRPRLPSDSPPVDETSTMLDPRFRESRRAWGNLPPRDRDEIIQGAAEQYLEKFRPFIDRYYQSLAGDAPP